MAVHDAPVWWRAVTGRLRGTAAASGHEDEATPHAAGREPVWAAPASAHGFVPATRSRSRPGGDVGDVRADGEDAAGDYELTDLGRSLLPVVRAVKDWPEVHMTDVRVARARFDRHAG